MQVTKNKFINLYMQKKVFNQLYKKIRNLTFLEELINYRFLALYK